MPISFDVALATVKRSISVMLFLLASYGWDKSYLGGGKVQIHETALAEVRPTEDIALADL